MPAGCRVFQIKDKTVENLTPNLIISICGTTLIAKLELHLLNLKRFVL